MLKALIFAGLVGCAFANSCESYPAYPLDAYMIGTSRMNGKLVSAYFACTNGETPNNGEIRCNDENEWATPSFQCPETTCYNYRRLAGSQGTSLSGKRGGPYTKAVYECENGNTVTLACKNDRWETGSCTETSVSTKASTKAPTAPAVDKPAVGNPLVGPVDFAAAEATPHKQQPTDCNDVPYVVGAYAAGRGKNGRGVYATYRCTSGDIKGTDTIYCKNGNWDQINFVCIGGVRSSAAVKTCGEAYVNDADTYTKPRPMTENQCVNGVTGPPSLCLTNNAQVTLEPVPIEEVVKRHNCWRHNAIPKPKVPLVDMKWDADLARLAERYVGTCQFGHDGNTDRILPSRSSHNGSWDRVGQNICYSSTKQSWSECIDGLSMEVVDFKYGVGEVGGQTGHYTQVVATESDAVGCGWAHCPNGLKGASYTYVQLCNYGRAGNVNYGNWNDNKTPFVKA